jgi:uncharacterized membrane protein YjfL (UPF0719 family)
MINILLIIDLLNGLGAGLVYALLGLALAVLAYKIIDWLTPGKMSEQIAQGNVALAIVAGAMILGVCFIIGSVLAA